MAPHVGSRRHFHATIETNITFGYPLARAGMLVTGRIAEAKPAGRLSGSAELAIERVNMKALLLSCIAGTKEGIGYDLDRGNIKLLGYGVDSELCRRFLCRPDDTLYPYERKVPEIPPDYPRFAEPFRDQLRERGSAGSAKPASRSSLSASGMSSCKRGRVKGKCLRSRNPVARYSCYWCILLATKPCLISQACGTPQANGLHLPNDP